MTNNKIDKSAIIYTSVTIAIFVICIIIGWNIVDADKQDVIKVFENQIISAQDNNMAKLLDNTYINYTRDNKSDEGDEIKEINSDKQNDESEQSNEIDSTEKTPEQLIVEEQEKEAFAGENHAIITTSANMSIVDLEVRYNEAGEIVILEYSNAQIWPKIVALIMSCIVASLLVLLWNDFADDVLP